MDFETLKQIITDTGYRPRSYSGRGMYGKNCIGVTVGDALPYLADMADECACAHDGESNIGWILRNVRQDSMGRDTILYWPNVKWED